MRHLISIIILFALSSCSRAHEILTYADYGCGEMGFIDTKGKWIVEPKYQNGYQFSERCAAVFTGYLDTPSNKWGYIDTKGHFIIKPQFDGAEPFDGGKAAVKLGKLWGIIDRSGNFITLPFSEKPLSCIFNSLNISNEPNNSIDDIKAVEVEQLSYVFKDKKGKDVFGKSWQFAGNFEDGYAIVMVANERYGVINRSGKTQIEPVHSYLSYIGKGFYGIGVMRDTIIDKKGKVIWTRTPCM